MRNTLAAAVCAIAVILSSSACRSGVQTQEVRNVIIDMDLGSSTDDIICLAMAYEYQKEGRLRVLGTIADRMGEQNAEMADILNTYFGYGNTPTGLERSGATDPMLFIDYAPVMTGMTDTDGNPFFKRSVNDYSQVLDAYKLYRKLLAEAEDGSVDIVSCGFVTALAQLLESGADEFSELDGVELVKRKVKGLHLQAGMFEQAQEPDFNFRQVPEFAMKFIELWPDEIPTFYNPMEVGQDVDYKPELLLEDLKEAEASPLYQIYSKCDCDTGQRMWDALNIVWLMEGDGMFNVSGRGQVRWTEGFSTTFEADSCGNCRYLIPFSSEQAETVLSFIRSKVSE